MAKSVPLSAINDSFTTTPIEFGYINPNRSTISAFDADVGTQGELRGIWDVSSSFDSVNFLTDVRSNINEVSVESLLARYTDNPPEVLSGSPACFNYWMTFPKHLDDTCRTLGTVIPLKNNFGIDEQVTCNPCVRTYTNFSFGSDTLDSYEPTLLFNSDFYNIDIGETDEVFRLPDYSPNIALSSLDFICFGAIAGDCPINSDRLIIDGKELWLSGGELSATWMERYFGLSGTCLSSSPELESVLYEDINVDNTVLVSAFDYIYKRPDFSHLISTGSIDECINLPDLTGRFGFLSDAGYVNTNQLSASNRLNNLGDLDAVFFGGDNNYESGLSATIEANWAVFDEYVQLETAYPAIGNHDIESDDLATAQSEKFTYLPNNKRYYSVVFDDSDMELFVLNSGAKSDNSIVEPDGNTVGSVQYNWFIDQLNLSTKKYRVVMFHHPYVTGKSAGQSKTIPAMDWGFEALGIDLILNGHTHTNQHLKHNNLDIVDISAPVRDPRKMSGSGSIYGSATAIPDTTLVWSDAGVGEYGTPCISFFEATACGLDFCVIRVSDAEILHRFSITNNRSFSGVVSDCGPRNTNGIIFSLGCLSGDKFLDESGLEHFLIES